MGGITEKGKERRGRCQRHLAWLPLAVAGLYVSLTLGAVAALAAPTTNGSAALTIGSCKVVSSPTATNFTKCAGAQLRGASLSGADLSYANLAKANLSGANLSAANLRAANLANANLTGTNLSQATVKGATLTGATWKGTTCPDATNSDNVGGTCGTHLSPAALSLPPSSTVGPGALPFTGLALVPLLASGTGLIALGLLLLGLTRSRRRVGLQSQGR